MWQYLTERTLVTSDFYWLNFVLGWKNCESDVNLQSSVINDAFLATLHFDVYSWHGAFD